MPMMRLYNALTSTVLEPYKGCYFEFCSYFLTILKSQVVSTSPFWRFKSLTVISDTGPSSVEFMTYFFN